MVRSTVMTHASLVALVLAGCSASTARTSVASTPPPAPTPTVPAASMTSMTSAADASANATNEATGDAASQQDAALATVTDAGSPQGATVAGGSAAEGELPPMPENVQGPPRPWARMSHRDKERYMDDVVLPTMTALFQAYDSQHYARVTCATCHGENARRVHFHMPNSLPALPAFGTEAAQRMMNEHPRMVRFMRERVVPVMARLLGETPYDPQTNRGFGCYDCHPRARQ